jgi:hypothetical protein
MGTISNINNYYSQIQEKHYNSEYEQFKNILLNQKILVRSQALKPYFITKKKREEFLRITDILLNIFEKLTCAYFNNSEIRNLLSVNGRIKDYIGIHPGYSGKSQVAHLDVFYDIKDDSLQFLEINLDNPSYIGMNVLLVGIFNQPPSLKHLSKEFSIKSDSLVDSLYNTLITKYREYCLYYKKQEQKEPNIAIVCSRNSFLKQDVEAIVKLLKKKNINVYYADPRDFVYDDKTLKINGEEIHIIYRDTLNDFFRTESIDKIHSSMRNTILNYTKNVCLKNNFIDHYLRKGYFGHAENIIKAYSENNIRMINPFTSGLCAQKFLFALIQDERFKTLINEEEWDIIKKHTPWTRILGDYETCFHNREINLADFIRVNRQKFVIKPNHGFGGKGILIGKEIKQKDWERKINSIIKSGSKYIVQEYIDIPTESFPVYYNDSFKGFSKQYFNINFWGFNRKFGGCFVRTSEQMIVNVSRGGKLVPVYYVEE